MGYGFALFAATPPEVIRASAREAEALGYDSFWVNHPGSVDGLASLAHAAKATTRIALGVGVIPLHTRGPESIVEGVKAQALPLDRLLLGVGSPNPASLTRVRDGVAALRAGLKTRVVVAALGPKMCHLAGEVADGVLFNWLTPAFARRAAEWVRAGADRGGAPASHPLRVCAGRAGPRRHRAARRGRRPLRRHSRLRRPLRAHGREAGGHVYRRDDAGRHPRALGRLEGRGGRGGAPRHHREGHGGGEPRAGARGDGEAVVKDGRIHQAP